MTTDYCSLQHKVSILYNGFGFYSLELNLQML